VLAVKLATTNSPVPGGGRNVQCAAEHCDLWEESRETSTKRCCDEGEMEERRRMYMYMYIYMYMHM